MINLSFISSNKLMVFL